MTDINIGAITESLNYKSDLDLGNTSPQLVDYIIDQQLPTAENNYTWYKLYRSGRVEQGGYYAYTTTDNHFQITFPISMDSENYTILTTLRNNNTNSGFVNVDNTRGISTTGFYCKITNKANAACSPLGVYWEVKGQSALNLT